MFTRALLRRPGPEMIAGLRRHDLGAPDFERALQQHAAYAAALRDCGLAVEVLDADPGFPDGCFVEDTAILSQGRVLLTRPGATERLGEVAAVATALAATDLTSASISTPGTLDGGDVCIAGQVAFIGISARSNEAGAEQLAAWLQPQGIVSRLVDIRHGIDLLHLKSGLTWLGDQRLVLDAALCGHPAFADFDVVVPDPEERYAANAIRVNDQVLIASGFPRLERRLNELGYRTLALDMSEFAKLDGGLSCLSLRY